MSTLIFRLRHVPEDEAQAIRELLDEQNIDWYETNAGNWGIAMPGIWVEDNEQAPQARYLIGQYQQERTLSQRELNAQLEAQGQNTTLKQRLLKHPFRSLGIVLFCAFILYVSIHPFMQMISFSKQ